MAKLFGSFQSLPENTHTYLILGFSPNSISIKQRWKNNGLSADFLADYTATFFPGEGAVADKLRQKELRAAISYVANELLENAMKFHDTSSPSPIQVQLYLLDDRVCFSITNSIAPHAVAPFQDFLDQFLSSDPGDFYVEQVEKSAERTASNDTNTSVSTIATPDCSGLGILTMAMDYGAELGWKFEPDPIEPTYTIVTTIAQIPV
jgi:hypothetical protein